MSLGVRRYIGNGWSVGAYLSWRTIGYLFLGVAVLGIYALVKLSEFTSIQGVVYSLAAIIGGLMIWAIAHPLILYHQEARAEAYNQRRTKAVKASAGRMGKDLESAREQLRAQRAKVKKYLGYHPTHETEFYHGQNGHLYSRSKQGKELLD